MLGLIVKVTIILGVVGIVGFAIHTKKGSIPNLKTELSHTISNINVNSLGKNLSSSLDSLVVNPESKSPVVLGVEISNDTISKIVDTLQNLPPEQISQIKDALCAPSPVPVE